MSELPSTIGELTGRTIVMCFDGTGDQFDDDNDNIVELFSMLDKSQPDKQIVYYQAGLATYNPNYTGLALTIWKFLDSWSAINIEQHIVEGYIFLMQNYKPGDRICMYGFSRGAYTARTVAGMVHKVGLLPASMISSVPTALKIYTDDSYKSFADARLFKDSFCREDPVTFEFLGLFDTIAGVGGGKNVKQYPFTSNNLSVRVVRHALAADERRRDFVPTFWGKNTWDDSLPKLVPGHYAKTDVKQVWFSGNHGDVGGGACANGAPHALSRITLRWMIRETLKAKAGVIIKTQKLYSTGLDVANLHPEVVSVKLTDSVVNSYIQPRVDRAQVQAQRKAEWAKARAKTFVNDPAYVDESQPLLPGEVARPKGVADTFDMPHYTLCHLRDPTAITTAPDEAKEEVIDALEANYDRLATVLLFKVLEWFPILRPQYDGKGGKKWVWYWGLSRPRVVKFYPDMYVHRSVLLRRQSKGYKDGKKYIPASEAIASLPEDSDRWTD